MKGIQEAIRALLQYGFQECTEAANQQDGTGYLCAFERPGEQQGIRYCCATEDDLFALLSLVEALENSLYPQTTDPLSEPVPSHHA